MVGSTLEVQTEVSIVLFRQPISSHVHVATLSVDWHLGSKTLSLKFMLSL